MREYRYVESSPSMTSYKVNRVALRRESFLVDREVLVGTGDRQDKRRDYGRARDVLFGRLMSRESGRPTLA